MPVQLSPSAIPAAAEAPRLLSGIATRAARQADLTPAARLVQRVVRECVSPSLEPPAPEEYSDFASPGALALRFLAGHKFWIATLSENVIGTLEVKGAGHILMLFIAPEFQRRGVARALLAAAFPGFPRCLHSLTVNSIPQSIAAYERFGFVRDGQEQNVRGLRFVPMRLDPPALP